MTPAVEAAREGASAGMTPGEEHEWWAGHDVGHAAGIAAGRTAALAEAREGDRLDAAMLPWAGWPDEGDEWVEVSAGLLDLWVDLLPDISARYGWSVMADGSELDHGTGRTIGEAQQAAAEAAARIARGILAALAGQPEAEARPLALVAETTTTQETPA